MYDLLFKTCKKDAAAEAYRKKHGGLGPIAVFITCDCPKCKKMMW